jgi:hypothetical protein
MDFSRIFPEQGFVADFLIKKQRIVRVNELTETGRRSEAKNDNMINI